MPGLLHPKAQDPWKEKDYLLDSKEWKMIQIVESKRLNSTQH
jgi:hypothetical protein